MDEIFVDDDGDIFIPEPPSTYDDVKPPEDTEPAMTVVAAGVTEEVCLDPITDKVWELLDDMVDELNRYHDDWLKTATEAEILDRRTGRKVSPKFELERIKDHEIDDYEGTVGLHDLENEESEYGDPKYIAERIMSICYFNGYHKESCGI
jgi:hypothetical protein